MLRPLEAKVSVAQPCLTLGDPMGYSPPGSSVHGSLQARILDWAAISSSRSLPYPGTQPRSPAPQWILYRLSHYGSSHPAPCPLSLFRRPLSTLASAFPALHTQFLHCTPAARPFSGAELHAAPPSHPKSAAPSAPGLQAACTLLLWDPVWSTAAESPLGPEAPHCPWLCHSTPSCEARQELTSLEPSFLAGKTEAVAKDTRPAGCNTRRA